jgi:hypothetical protein
VYWRHWRRSVQSGRFSWPQEGCRSSADRVREGARVAIIDRRFTYKGVIRVSTSDLHLAQTGRKSCTIRLGCLNVARPLLSLTDGSQELPIRVTRVENTRTFNELTDEDAVLDGLASKADLAQDLARYYGSIDPGQPVTVIHFRLVDQATHPTQKTR